MKKTTVYLPDELAELLKSVASKEDMSEADIIRQGLAYWLRMLNAPAPTIPLFSASVPDLAEKADDYLEGFGQN